MFEFKMRRGVHAPMLRIFARIYPFLHSDQGLNYDDDTHVISNRSNRPYTCISTLEMAPLATVRLRSLQRTEPHLDQWEDVDMLFRNGLANVGGHCEMAQYFIDRDHPLA